MSAGLRPIGANSVVEEFGVQERQRHSGTPLNLQKLSGQNGLYQVLEFDGAQILPFCIGYTNFVVTVLHFLVGLLAMCGKISVGPAPSTVDW